MDSEQHLTAWSDDSFAALVERIESGIRDARLVLLSGGRGPIGLAAIGGRETWLDQYAGQLKTVLDLAVFAFEGYDDLDLRDWAALEPQSDPEQAARWIGRLRDSARSLRAEWTVHRDSHDRVVASALPQIVLDPSRGRALGQLVIRTLVTVDAGVDAGAGALEAQTVTLTLSKNELLYLADRAQQAAAMVEAIPDAPFDEEELRDEG